eukprot:TRINITY_DN10677_c0_g1_i1.p1 TRINITY_DN10677_c0_g1~~TRINITY_DN10677_c0_g1_i1.p1  ORF type:complete len:164 (-),score=33.27 TRINITY_DN10677_c0_g1_i1:243-734(-)
MPEEVILTSEDLMLGLPSPSLTPDIPSSVSHGLDICSQQLRDLFLCLHRHDIEPFCQDQIIRFRRCSQRRDEELRERILQEERKIGLELPLSEGEQRAETLKAAVTLLERQLILASGVPGAKGFKQRWQLNGQLVDTRNRLKALEDAIAVKKEAPSKSRWFWS